MIDRAVCCECVPYYTSQNISLCHFTVLIKLLCKLSHWFSLSSVTNTDAIVYQWIYYSMVSGHWGYHGNQSGILWPCTHHVTYTYAWSPLTFLIPMRSWLSALGTQYRWHPLESYHWSHPVDSELYLRLAHIHLQCELDVSLCPATLLLAPAKHQLGLGRGERDV